MANLLSTTVNGSLLALNNGVTNAYTTASNGRLFLGSNAQNDYSIYTHMEDFGGNYTKLTLDWHTGIKIGASQAYGGIRFYSDSITNSGVRLFSVGEGDANVRVTNNLYIGSSGGWITDLLAAKQNASTAITTGNIGSQSVSFATSAGALTSMNISQFTNNSGYITSGDTTTGIFTTFLGNGTSNIGSGYTRVIRNENGLGGNPNYAPILHIAASDTMWQIAGPHAGQTNLVWRSGYAGTWETPWWTILHTGNYTSFAPSLTGTGASGTWGISITGNANTATTAGDSTNLGGRSSSRYLYYRGYSTSGDFQTLQSTESIIRFDQVGVIDSWSNAPGGVYTYGGVLSLRGDNFGLQIYGSHTGDLVFKTQWNNDQYSGWRNIIHSANIGDYALTSLPAHTHTIANVTGLQTALDGKQAAGSYVAANGTSAGNIDDDWGQSFKTFDPIPSGTPPLQSPNIRTINVGDSYSRRTQLAFDYASDVAYFRRRTEAGWFTWREFIHSGNIGSQSVSYATTAGSVSGGLTTSNYASTLDGRYFFDFGFTIGYPGTDANNMPGNRSAFTYSNGAPYTGPIAHFGAAGYGLQLNANYGTGTLLGFRVRNGDNGTWNAWREIIHSGNIGSQSVSYAASAGDSTNLGGASASRYVRNDIYNSVDAGLQVFRNIGSIDGSWPSSDHTLGLENNDAGTIVVNFHRAGYTSNNLWYNGSQFRFDTVVTSTSDFRAPIFYDSADTAYYLDPSNTLKSLNVAGNIDLIARSAAWAEGIRVRVPSTSTWGGIRFTRDRGNDDGNWAIGFTGIDSTDDLTFWGNTAGNGAMRMRLDHSSNLIAYGSMRAPIFYDSQNTGYYGDFASTSVMNAIRLGTSTNSGTISGGGDWGIRFANDNGWIQFGPANNSWTHIYTDKNFYFNQNLYVNGTQVVLNSGTWGINVTGSAASASSSSRSSALDIVGYGNGNMTYYQSSGTFAGQTGWAGYFISNHGDGATYYNQTIIMPFWGAPQYSRLQGGTLVGPYTFWTTENLNDYAPNMNQYVRTTDNVTFNTTTSPTILVNNHSDNTRGYRIHNTSGSSVSAMFTNSANALVIGAGAFDQVQLNKKTLINGAALGVNVAASATAGRIDASNDIVAYSSSDERLKYNIAPIENALDKLKSLTGVEFDWKPEYKHAHGYEGHDTGIIAQQVEAIMPSAVRTNDTGFLAVRYEKLIGLLIEGMKEQQAQIDELKAKLDGLTK